MLSIAIAIVFILGLFLYGAGSMMVRRAREAPVATAPIRAVAWTSLVDESLVDVSLEERADMLERLALLDTAWSRSVLERARREEREPLLLGTIERALQT